MSCWALLLVENNSLVIHPFACYIEQFKCWIREYAGAQYTPDVEKGFSG